MAVKVRLKDGSNNVLHPETDWSVVLNKPSIKLKYTDGSHDTGTDSKIDAVTSMVGDGEAWDTYSNGGKSIVIGNSHNALGFCGDNTKRYSTVLQSKHPIFIMTEGDIKMNSNATGNKSVSLADYPINWTALNDRPFNEILSLKNHDGSSTAPSSVENAVFGTYYFVEPSSDPTDPTKVTTVYYPAFAIVTFKLGGSALQAERKKGYYLSANGTLQEIPDMGHFSGLLDSRKKNQ